MNSSLENKETRFFVKIKTGHAGRQKVAYYRNDMSYAFFKKWRWFFEYRAAKIKVDSPRIKVELTTGSYDFIPPAEIYIKRLKDVIKARKAALTKYKNKVKRASKKYSQSSLFSIEQDPQYYKVETELKRLEKRVKQAVDKLDTFSSENKLPNDLSIAPYSSEDIINL
jgi:hypothetical protein